MTIGEARAWYAGMLDHGMCNRETFAVGLRLANHDRAEGIRETVFAELARLDQLAQDAPEEAARISAAIATRVRPGGS